MAERCAPGVAVDRVPAGGERGGPRVQLDVRVRLIGITRGECQDGFVARECPSMHQRVAAGLGFMNGVGGLSTSDSLEDRDC